jgi:hypothetical protein
VLVDDESEELAGPDDVATSAREPVAPERPAPEPVARNPRQVRARRRRRRRQIGTLIFVLVAGAILATAYFAIAGGDDSTDDATGTSAGATTTTAPPFSASYAVITGVNVRPTPGTASPTIAVVEQGHDVTVLCVVEGESVTAASGKVSTQWLKVGGLWPAGYVSAAFVRTGEDLTSQKIPVCPAA